MRRTTVTTLSFVCIGVLMAVAAVVVQRRGAAARDATIAASLEAARRAEAAGDTAAAVTQFRRYVELVGDQADPEARSDFARLLLARAAVPRARPSEIDEAFDLAEVSIRRRPDDIALLRAFAEAKVARKRHAEAREHLLVLREKVASSPEAGRIDVEIARTWIGSGDEEQAMGILSGLVGFDPASRTFVEGESRGPAEAYLALESLIRQDRNLADTADAVLERCISLYPDDPAVLVALSGAKLAASKPNEALESANAAMAIAPSDPAVLLAHGKALAATRDFTAAGDAWTEARRRLPEDQSLFAAAARHFMRHGTPEQVLETLDAAIERFPNQQVTLSLIAAMPIGAGKRAEFDSRLSSARQRLGESHPIVVVLGARLLESRGRLCAAEKSLERARLIVPAQSKGNIDELLADCHRKLGEHDLACGEWQRLAEGQGRWTTAMAGMARSRLELGQSEEAAKVASRLEGRWLKGDGVGGNLAEALSVIVPVIRARPPGERDWSGVDRLLARLESSRAPAWRKAMIGAETLAAKGDYIGALAVVEPVVEEAPRHQLDATHLALLARVRGMDAAWERFDTFDSVRRSRAANLLALVHAYSQLCRGDERAWFDRALSATAELSPPESLQVLHSMAAIATAAGWDEEAASCRREAAKRIAADYRAPLCDALCAVRKGDAKGATVAAARVTKLEGADSPRAKVAAAAALISAARAGEPGKVIASSMPYRLDASVASRLQEASKLLLEAANVRPRWHVISELHAEIAWLEGDFPKASSFLREAIDGGGSGDPEIVAKLVEALRRSHRIAEADEVCLRCAPQSVGGLDRPAIGAMLACGDILPAVERTLEAVDLESVGEATLVWLGRSMASVGRNQEARQMFLRATHAAPTSPEPWLWLARSQVEQGDVPEAESTIATALGQISEDQRSLFAARGAAVVGRDDDAERGLREVTLAGGGSIAAAGHAVDFFAQRRRPKDAKAFLRELIAESGIGHDDLVYWARTRLADLDRGPGSGLIPSTDRRRVVPTK